MGGMSQADDDSSFRRKRGSRIFWIVAVVAGVLGGFTIGILIGRFATCPSDDQDPSKDRSQDPESQIETDLMQSISAKNIEDNLKFLTQSPHIAGNTRDFELVDYLKNKFTEYGLDSVKSAPYEVLLSYPDQNNPNTVQLFDKTSNVVLFDSTTTESNISHLAGVIRPFLAYSPSGIVTASRLIYVNYGRVEDFEYLRTNRTMNFSDSIVIARYGKIFRGSKVDIAARYGAKGIIIYSDPADYTWPLEDSRVFPDTWWLPPSGAQRGTIFTGDGDALTPGYPALSTAYRYNETDPKAQLPTIPAHAMGYGGAMHFLKEMQGDEVPQDWRGSLNVTYRLGPNITSGLSILLNVTTSNSIRRADNIIAILKGAVEPDRYVLMGNHRDAWVYGAIDPSSGTAVMMEVARAMGQLVKQKKWRPRRSIMFCSWGAEEFGLLGSNEWVEQYVKFLGARAVAYVNIDIAVQGNYSFRSLGTPLMYRAAFEATKKVPNPNEAEVSQNRRTVYDTWKNSFPWGSGRPDDPYVGDLGSGSDYAPLLQIAGITSVDVRYTYNSNQYKIGSYPLYHTEYETFDAVKTLIDKEFKYHQAVGQVGAEIVRSMADSLIIPFNVSDYAWALEMNRQTLDKEFGTLLRSKIPSYTELQGVIEGFKQDVKDFEKAVSEVNKEDPMAVRMINDQLLLLEKAFLDPTGLPARPLKKHLIFAENANDVYAGTSFPGLVDLLFEIDKLSGEELTRRWEEVRRHFSVLLYAIQAAGFTLRDVAAFIEEKY